MNREEWEKNALRTAEELRETVAKGNVELVGFLGNADGVIEENALRGVEESFVGRLLCFVSFSERKVAGRIRRATLMVTNRFSLRYVLEMEERENGKAVMYSFTLPDAAALYKHRYLKTSEPYDGQRYEVIRIEDDKGRGV